MVSYIKKVVVKRKLTDIAKTRDAENPSQIISLWMRTYNTVEYLGLWETQKTVKDKAGL